MPVAWTAAAGLCAFAGGRAEIGAQEQMMPPGPGWASAGPAVMVLDGAPSSIAPLSAPRVPVWLAVSRPFGVPDLTHAYAEVSAAASRTAVSLTLSHLTGDGMTATAIQVDACRMVSGTHSEPAPVTGMRPRFLLGLGWSMHRLAGRGSRDATASRLRVGAGFECGPLRAWASDEVPLTGWLRRRIAWAVGWRLASWTAAVGERLEEGVRRIRASVAQARLGGLRLTAGMWGEPPALSAGISMPLAGCVFGAEIRHVPGPGLYLLWSLCLPAGSGP